MIDWKELTHAYGSAEDVPDLLAQLSPDSESEVWSELWSCLCHQGSVYSASFAALPALANAAARWHPKNRLQPLMLAASILSSNDVHSHASVASPDKGLVTHFRELCEESLACPQIRRDDFIYLLQSTCSFEGNHFWGRQLDQLVNGEFSGVCPYCATDLYIVIGKYGFFISAEEWVRRSKTRRAAIAPNEGEMPMVGQRMVELAGAADQEEVESWIKHVFGTSECPACVRLLSVADAIAANETGGASL
jgi:hypothetical protein